ncbi:tetratricopeptide repeat protein [Candidatus Obscuribacterales bacterium]|nr:tetratricopeptide repeat protein [Candidatus Obscuribacterales bacterium]
MADETTMDPEKVSEWNEHIQTAERAQRAAKYDYAEATWMLAVEEAESFGTRDARLAYSLEKLTECLWFQGRLEEALHYGARGLQIYEAALGTSHNDVGSMAYNVAMIYHMLSYFDEAEKHYKRALAIKTGTLGAKHPDVVKVLSSFADLLVKLGREEEASQLRATEKVVTAANWSQTNSGRDVGGQALGFAQSLGAVSGSYPPYRPGAAVSGSYPPVPPPGAVSGANPQVSGVASGAYPPVQGAVSGSHQPVQGQGAVSGSHQSVKAPSNMDSGAYPQPVVEGPVKPAHSSLIKQIRRASADSPYAQGIQPPPGGPGAPGTGDGSTGAAAASAAASSAPSTWYSNAATDKYLAKSARLALPISGHYGRTWEDLKRHAESGLGEGNLVQAEGAWREAMSLAKGDNPDNPSYCYVLETLGEVYLRLKNYERAEDCLCTAYGIKKRVLGDEHGAVAGGASNLARLFYVIHQFAEAEEYSHEAVKIQEKLLGPNSIEAATAMHNLATVYHVQKKYAQAEPFYERAMKIKQLQLGGDHPDTVRILKSYAALLRSTHREEQADMLDNCVTGMISGRWRAVEIKPKDTPEEGWWKQDLFGDE